jgi:hypothetical protein
MTTGRNDQLGELAADAALERADFLVQATDQFRAFLERHRDRISAIGGLTLIDEDPEFLSIAPDLTFRSRSRYQDEDTGEWVSETEVIESAAEIVELYNPADLYTAFAEAARELAGLSAEPTAAGELLDAAHVPAADSFAVDEGVYAEAADSWAAGQADLGPPADEQEAARRLYDLALAFQDRSQRAESRLFDQFTQQAEALTGVLGDFVVVDDDDERLSLARDGSFRAEVVPDDGTGEWRTLNGPDDLVEFYDPTDVFGDLADALAEAFPVAAADGPDDAAMAATRNGDGPLAEGDEGEEGDEDEDDEDDDEEDTGPDGGTTGNGRGGRDRA